MSDAPKSSASAPSEGSCRLSEALGRAEVVKAAWAVKKQWPLLGLSELLQLGQALAEAMGQEPLAAILKAEIEGYKDEALEVPSERRVVGFASAFPVRALDQGLLMPEEIFLSNREKFSQVVLTISQPILELQEALNQIREGGVLSLRVPASEISRESAETDPDTQVYIYILPREVERIVQGTRSRALRAVVGCLVDAALEGQDEPEDTWVDADAF